ncbi:MAG: glycosyltransferase family 39 protein [Chloroflexi bacterium]|nr:glycosyltransferase family 39 protein [Chloroflexota bacterium]
MTTTHTDKNSFWTERRGEIVALLLIAALAAFFRFWQLDTTPPGLHYDEAFNSLYSLRISRGEMLPIFMPENNGEEPLHIYLTALYFYLVGPTPIGGRLVSAASGVVTVVSLYFLAVELFRGYGRKAAGQIGLLASLFLAIWYWSIHYNRIGMEPSMAPMMAVPAMLFIWRTVRTGAMRDAILAGFFTAASLYTYQAGRTIPVMAFLVVLYHLLFARPLLRQRLPQLGVALLAAALTFLPLGLYFLRHPEWLLMRPQQTTAATIGGESPWVSLWQGITAVLRGFAWRSDTNWRQNLPGRPMMDWLQFAFYVIGLAACLRRLKDNPYWFLLVWTALSFLPTILTEYPPHHGRSLIATLPLALTMALGAWLVGREILQRVPNRRLGQGIVLAGLAAAVFYSGSRAYNDYFHQWGTSPWLFAAFDVGLRAIGEYAGKLPDEEPIYLTPIPGDWYTLTFAMDGRDKRLRTYNGRTCLVFPAETTQTTHQLIVSEDGRSLARLQAIFPQGRQVWQYHNPYDGSLYAFDYAIPPGQRAQTQPQFPFQANFADQIMLQGYDLEPTTAPGQPLHLRLWWYLAAPTPINYTVFIHLIGETNPATGSPVWAQRDTRPCDNAYLTPRWRPGEIIADEYTLDLPTDLPIGSYTLQVGLYDWFTGERMAVQSASGPFENNVVPLTAVQVVNP